MTDATTAFLAFAALFGGLAAYLARLAVAARRLEERLERLEGKA
jgi:CcmD family protein